MRPLLFNIGAEALAARLCAAHGFEPGALLARHFPDGESWVQLLSPVAGRDLVFLCPLDRPDEKTLGLLFAADAARDGGARSVGLVAPYLAYMRQDAAFHPGEAVSSVTYARLLSGAFDWLVTVDPHLHRHASLSPLYAIPAEAVRAAPAIARWIAANVSAPLLIGPDAESEQWVAEVAALAGAPHTVLSKTRSGDYAVSLAGSAGALGGRTPVIVDDIVSSAATMAEAVRLVRGEGGAAPVCIAVHALFAGDAWQRLEAAGPARLVSVETVAHPSNAIRVDEEIAAAVGRRLAALGI